MIVMIRIEINNTQFNTFKDDHSLIQQEEIGRKYEAEIVRNGKVENVLIVGHFTLTGETSDFYEISKFGWETSNDFNGEWNPNWNRESFINGNYSLDDYVDDEIIDEIISEKNSIVLKKYYITNLPPASEITMSNPVNMTVEKEYDGRNQEITPEILKLMDWRNFYVPDSRGIGSLKTIGELLSLF